MRPALSVLLLTTLIGAGQGLFLALVTVQLYALFALVPPPDPAFYRVGTLLAPALLAGGLLASFFHLGRPERAWRAAACWRTSWLAREVILLPALVGILVLYALGHALGWYAPWIVLPSGAPLDATVLLGVLGTLLAFALFVCTAMIYACLPFLREWHSWLTVVNYTLLGGASGFTLAAALAAAASPPLAPFLTGWAIVITLLGFVSRAATLVRNARLKPKSALQTALGVKHPRIVQLSQGAMGGSFNTREFFHGRAQGTLHTIRWMFVVLVFAVPLVFLTLALLGSAAPGVLLAAAFAVQFPGLLAERWYFFAEARHPQNLYYQALA
ncbi:MAG TPA: DmsC/YnfH family molybdoenzyme membrane anchor subunit [Burkholderiaceae bacterium]|nr:DmsC/YnfH family molybdoenzyme membrane anchor subunit [Burkholderiaceae bacterium]